MMGYVYMKTKNIWATAIIHAINNSMGTASLYTSDKIVWTYESIMNNSQIMRFTVVILILTIIFSTYLFTKEYSGKVEMKV
jgi:CAAX amino terminal protease family protein